MSNKIEMPEYTGEAIDLEAAGIRYGFRYDPMEWVNTAPPAQAAQVRTLLFGARRPDDLAFLQEQIDAVVGKQKPDGSIGDPDGDPDALAEDTASQAVQLLEFGCPASDPAVTKATDFAARLRLRQHGRLFDGPLLAACLTGWREGDEPAKSLLALAAEQKGSAEPGGCPWSIGAGHALWAGREHLPAPDDALDAAFGWLVERTNAAGFYTMRHQLSILEHAGNVNHALGRQLALKLLPTVLRAQQTDGGWESETYGAAGDLTWGPWRFGQRNEPSFLFFKVLVQYGLLAPLRELPPLPPDWRIVRSIPDPPGPEDWYLAWGDGKLWRNTDHKTTTVSISPEDGQVIDTLPHGVKNPHGTGWWDDCLAYNDWATQSLIKVDPRTGKHLDRVEYGQWMEHDSNCIFQRDGKLWVGDQHNWLVCRIDLNQRTKADYVLMCCPTGPAGSSFAATPDGIWHFDVAWRALVKTPYDAPSGPWGTWETDPRTPELLDWGERPEGASGLTWDGQNLWMLDAKNRRLCIIEKTESGKEITAVLAAKRKGGE